MDKKGKEPAHEATSEDANVERGPYSAPEPHEADRVDQGEPMAVANDRATPHGESFLPTTNRFIRDVMDADVAHRYKTVPDSARRGSTPKDESRHASPRDAEGGPHAQEHVAQQEAPPGYTQADEKGWKRLKDEGGGDV